MNRLEHYVEAEWLVTLADRFSPPSPSHVARAQVHATLASCPPDVEPIEADVAEKGDNV